MVHHSIYSIIGALIFTRDGKSGYQQLLQYNEIRVTWPGAEMIHNPQSIYLLEIPG